MNAPPLEQGRESYRVTAGFAVSRSARRVGKRGRRGRGAECAYPLVEVDGRGERGAEVALDVRIRKVGGSKPVQHHGALHWSNLNPRLGDGNERRREEEGGGERGGGARETRGGGRHRAASATGGGDRGGGVGAHGEWVPDRVPSGHGASVTLGPTEQEGKGKKVRRVPPSNGRQAGWP